MATKDIILNKIHALISTNFSNPEDAFAFFDEDRDVKLAKKEIVNLL